MGSRQNSMNASQQNNISLSQNSPSTLQNNARRMPQVHQSQHLKQQQVQEQQQQQQLSQSQQTKQQSQQHQRQQHLMQQQKHHLLQRPALQQPWLQQRKQQTGQLPVQQSAQINQINEINGMKLRQASGLQQHHPPCQRHNYFRPQARYFPISSQNLQASSPQISRHPSPQVDQHGLRSSHPTNQPLQSSNSPLVVPSPSTTVAQSPVPGDSEKQSILSLSNTVTIGHQQTGLTSQQHFGTPGISASPLLAKFASPDGNQGNASAVISNKSTIAERPLDRLIKAVQSTSPNVLKSSVSDIASVVSMVDMIAGSPPGNGSRAAIGEDLAAATKCRLQVRNFMSQGRGASTTSYSLNTSELESTATSNIRRQKFEVSHTLLEEIREINQQLIETVVIISNEGAESCATVAGGEGTLVRFSFSPVACSPSFKSQFASAQMSPIMPLRLLVPVSYPKCSPVVLDKFPVELSQGFEDLSAKAKSKFSASLCALSQPMLLKDMAKTWNFCARTVIMEFAEQMGGGSFSSRYGIWKIVKHDLAKSGRTRI